MRTDRKDSLAEGAGRRVEVVRASGRFRKRRYCTAGNKAVEREEVVLEVDWRQVNELDGYIVRRKRRRLIRRKVIQ